MSFLKNYIELNDTARNAQEISEKLKTLIDKCLKELNQYLDEDKKENVKVPAIISNYTPPGFVPKKVKEENSS